MAETRPHPTVLPNSTSPVPDAEKQGSIPNHIAIVMDGNGRWARERKLPRTAGHRQGVSATQKIVEHCVRRKVRSLTLFAFSSENWKRPKQEVTTLIKLFGITLKKQIAKLSRNNVRLRFVGDISAFPESLRQEMERGELHTRDNQGLILNIAVNYGGRWDIVQAARRLVRDVQEGRLLVDAIDDAQIFERLSLGADCEPDLLIRTGGEQRISNFLLWQTAYTEFYFTDVLWPDFNEACLEAAFEDYAGRQRRFGRTGEQVLGVNANA